MTLKMCRSLLIETISLSDQSLSSIGESVSETIRVAINRVTERSIITHLIAYLIDIQTKQISRLLAIKSKQFSSECLSKLSSLKRPKKQLIANQNICENIANILKDIKESIKNSNEVTKTELTYISGRDLEEVIDDFTFAFEVQQIDSSFLSQINIVIIKPSVGTNVSFGYTSSDFNGIPEELRPLLEIQTIEDKEISINGYFKVWLHDLNIESERVRINFNSKTGHHMSGEKLVIRCDLREAIIDLNRLPIDKSGKALNFRQIQTIESLSNICETNGCYELEILGLISRLGLCESILFGIPYILSATRSSELELNEMELNCQRFQALIQVLNEKNAVIVLKQKIQNNCLKRLFVLMSSTNSKTLLMKEMATKELVLPYFTDSYEKMCSKSPTKPIIDSIRSNLSDIPSADILNPLYIKTNLFDIL